MAKRESDALGRESNPAPLSGQTVLITRAEQPWLGADSMKVSLEQLGAITISQPAIEIIPTADWSQVDEVISRLESFDWLVFVSGNGVHFLVERLRKQFGKIENLDGLKFATIGEKTAFHLKQIAGFESSLSPEKSNSESLADALIEAMSNRQANEKAIVVRGNRGSRVLANRISQAGLEFEEVVVYESRDVAAVDEKVVEQLRAGEIDWVTISSSAIARSTVAMLGTDLQKAKTVSISPTTSRALRECGVVPTVEAEEFSVAGMVKAILSVTTEDD